MNICVMFSGEDKRIKVWELKNGTVLKDLRGHTDNIHTLDFNRDGTLLASGLYTELLLIWKMKYLLYTAVISRQFNLCIIIWTSNTCASIVQHAGRIA